MTKNTVIFIFLNMIYLLIWYATNKIRSTKVGKELDNGFEFYNSLNTSDKEKYWKEDTPALMRELLEILKSIDDYSFANTEKIISAWITEKGLGFGKVMNPFRVAIIGAAKGPHMFDVIEIIGKEETIRRMEKALSTL